MDGERQRESARERERVASTYRYSLPGVLGVCTYAHTYIHTYIHTYMHANIDIPSEKQLCVYINIYIYVEVCKQVNHECKLNKRMHISIYIYIYIFTCTCVHIYIHMCMCIYIYIYVCISMHKCMDGGGWMAVGMHVHCLLV